MKLATHLNYASGFHKGVDDIVDMEKAGLDLVWVPEAYGFDSPSLTGFLAARTSAVEIGASILPIFTRTPTLLAMIAAGIDNLSEGRFHLGLGASGPQVIESFHGVRYDNPLGRTREIVEICRDVWLREALLVHECKNYALPLPRERGSGLGKALKIIARPFRPAIPIWIAALGEKKRETNGRGRKRLDSVPLRTGLRQKGVWDRARRRSQEARHLVGTLDGHRRRTVGYW